MSSGELPVRVQSSTWMARIKICLSTLARKTPGSAELARNSRSVRVHERASYHFLLACFSPYMNL
jgi:hypothetical protein